jgi:ABC-type antimicrobial peptide transport system permease subunit
VFLYVYRNMIARFRANALTMLAVCLFVIGGSLGLSFYQGLRSMLIDSTPAENIVVLSKGAESEVGSKIPIETARKVVLLDGVKRNGETPLAVRELLTRIYLGAAGASAVTIRGIDDQSMQVHRVKLVQGAMPAPGSLEIILGRRVAKEYSDLKIGDDVVLPAGPSRIVGIISADNGPIEDEVWMPRAGLEAHMKTKNSTSVTLAAQDASRVSDLVDKINVSKDMEAQAISATKMNEDRGNLATVSRIVFVLLILLSVVATFAIATTMASAAAARMPELAAFAAIGIRRGVLGRIILFESALLALVGALVGVLLSALIRSQLGEISLGASPVEMTSTPAILLGGVGLGVAVGLVGGIIPAIKVSRLDIVSALR